MRKLGFLALMLASVLLTASAVRADIPATTPFTWTAPGTGNVYSFTVDGSVQLYQVSGGTTGGPFRLHKRNASYGTDMDLVAEGIHVWCLENDIYFSPGGVYVATIDDVVYQGDLGDNIDYDVLAERSKEVYNAYLEGALPRSGDGLGDIRDTIWYAQGLGGSDKIALSPALPAYNSNDFKVLNLWTLQLQNGEYVATDVQSQIVKVPVPAAVLLGGLGLGLVGWLRRRKAKA